MLIQVRDNNVDQALRVLKKKLQQEVVLREMRRRDTTRSHPKNVRERRQKGFVVPESSRRRS